MAELNSLPEFVMLYRLFPYSFVGRKLWNKVMEIQEKIGSCK